MKTKKNYFLAAILAVPLVLYTASPVLADVIDTPELLASKLPRFLIALAVCGVVLAALILIRIFWKKK